MILTIIVTYNGEKYIEDCLKSLLAQTQKTDILLVDNKSLDNTCKIVQEKYPEVNIINIEYNSGFAHANNVGIQYALNKGYDYVMLINEDTISDKKLIEELLKYSGKQTAVIPKIYKNGSLTKVWYAAGKIDFEKCKAVNCQENSINQVTRVSFMTGCCMLVHTDVFRKIGLFDENYFMYYEDTDFSLRMYCNNIEMLYIPSAFVWHRIQGKMEKGYYVYYMERNRLYFLKKYATLFHCKISKLIINELQQMILEPDIYTLVFFRYKVKGILDFIRNKMGMMSG